MSGGARRVRSRAVALAAGLAFSSNSTHAAQGHVVPEATTRGIVDAAIAQTRSPVTYDGGYRRIPYPGGDVPASIGVCTDVVIRAYRKVGVDLQVKVHEDMRRAFGEYPRAWGLSKPDPNIDHRRVPNLQAYFDRAGAGLPVSRDAGDYQAGDLVAWMLPGNLPHIGIVSDRTVDGTDRPRIIHNIGAGPVEDDILFAFPITGHYRYPVPEPRSPD